MYATEIAEREFACWMPPESSSVFATSKHTKRMTEVATFWYLEVPGEVLGEVPEEVPGEVRGEVRGELEGKVASKVMIYILKIANLKLVRLFLSTFLYLYATTYNSKP